MEQRRKGKFKKISLCQRFLSILACQKNSQNSEKFKSWLWFIIEKEHRLILAKRSSHRGSVVTNPTSNHEDAGSIPGLSQLVKDLACCDLWYRSQMGLGSDVAVA